MLVYILRRLWQSVLTVFGVMLFTFLLFRCVSGDIATANKGPKATEREKAVWRHKYGYDRPLIINLHRCLTIEDKSAGENPLSISDTPGSQAAEKLTMFLGRPVWNDSPEETSNGRNGDTKNKTHFLMGKYVFMLSRSDPVESLTNGKSLSKDAQQPTSTPASNPAATIPAAATADNKSEKAPPSPNSIVAFKLADGSAIEVDLAGAKTCGDIIDRINNAPANNGKLLAGISSISPTGIFNSQFFHFLIDTVTFRTVSLKPGDNRTLMAIIREHAPASLSLTVPAMAIEWFIGLAIACLVAYYRSTWIDKFVVFLTVLGMSIPFLAFMIYGQWLMFAIAPQHAYGLLYRGNIYLPISIMVLAGIGGMVRFYRTVILDEINRDYVRTARAKGLPTTTVLFKHVLRNCMLPILTSLIMSIPFLIMGSLLVESFFGIPGLGDLLISSIQDRDEPIMNGLVFMTALIYVFGTLLTDISYAIFDPRIRLK